MATDAQILSEAKASLYRILQTDTSTWSETARSQQQLQLGQLRQLISDYEAKTAASDGRRPFRPVKRVDL